MEKGNGKFEVSPVCSVGVVADSEFIVYGVRKGHRVAVLGPLRADDRVWRSEMRAHGFDRVEVVTKGTWTFEFVERSDGKERLDKTPVAVPVRQAPPTLSEQVRALVAQELSFQAHQQGLETFEEANDFEVDDDDEWTSPYEFFEMEEDYDFLPEGPAPEDESDGPLQGAGEVPGDPGTAPGGSDADPGAGAPGGLSASTSP